MFFASYGTGAVMAVPAHDQRDWEFAKQFDLPIVEVLEGGNVAEAAYTEDGLHVNSDFLDGLNKRRRYCQDCGLVGRKRLWTREGYLPSPRLAL